MHVLRVLRFGPLDAPLDLAHVVEVVAEASAIARADLALQIARFFGDRVEDAAIFLHALRGARPACPARPNIRSNATRGLISIGCDCVSDAHEMRVHVGAAVARARSRRRSR